MSGRKLFMLLLVATSAGCTHTVALGHPGTGGYYDAVSQSLAGRPVEVRTENETLAPLLNVELAGDSLFGLYPHGGGRRAVPLREIVEINGGKDHRDGAIHGLRLGALIGAAAGFLTSMSSEEGCYTSPCPGTTAYVLESAAAGAMWGVVVGSIRGNRIRYVVGR